MRASVLSRSAVFLGAAVLVVGACSPGGDEGGLSGAGSDDGVLDLGYVLPETGQLAYLGAPQIQAAEMAVRDINEEGGVLGGPIPELVGADEGGEESVAVDSTNHVLSSGVDAVLGAASTEMSLAVIDDITGSGVAQCSASNTAATFTDYADDGFYFRTAASDTLQAPVLSDLVQEDGHERVALLGRADEYGRGLVDATEETLEAIDKNVVLTDTYDPEANDFDQLVQQVSDADPDAVVLASFEEGSQLIRDLIDAGMGPEEIGVYGADGLRNTRLASLVESEDPSVLAGMKGTAPASAENEEFVDELREFAPDLDEMQFAPQMYDCVTILALAVESAKTSDPIVFTDNITEVTRNGEECASFAECRDLLDEGRDIDYEGVSGPLDFIEEGEPAQSTIEVYGYDENGDFESLGTRESDPEE